MNLHLEILEINNDVDNYENQTVKFSIYDDEDTGLVSFIDKINIAHAWFLFNTVGVDKDTAYGQLLYAIDSEGLENLSVGQSFHSEENEDDYHPIG